MKQVNLITTHLNSESFLIKRNSISNDFIEKIKNHISIAKENEEYFNFGSFSKEWEIEIDEHFIKGNKNYSKFHIGTYLNDFLKIPSDLIKWY